MLSSQHFERSCQSSKCVMLGSQLWKWPQESADFVVTLHFWPKEENVAELSPLSPDWVPSYFGCFQKSNELSRDTNLPFIRVFKGSEENTENGILHTIKEWQNHWIKCGETTQNRLGDALKFAVSKLLITAVLILSTVAESGRERPEAHQTWFLFFLNPQLLCISQPVFHLDSLYV